MSVKRKDFEHIRKTMGAKSAKEFVKASYAKSKALKKAK